MTGERITLISWNFDDQPHDTHRSQTPPSAGTGGEEIRNPLRFFMWLTQTYGDIVQYRSSVEPAYLINHPDYIRQVLQSNGQNYNKDTFLNKYMLEALTGQGF